MRRDFSNFHTSTIPAAFLRRPRDEIHPPRGLRALARNILRCLPRMRKNRVALLIIVTLFCVGLVIRSKGLWKQKPVHEELGVSDVFQDDPESDTEEMGASLQASAGVDKPGSNPPKDIEDESMDDEDDAEDDPAAESDPDDATHVTDEEMKTEDSTQLSQSTVYANTIIIGAAYSGTNPLAAMLSLHPNIAVTQGQIRFFTDNYDKGLKWYSSMMTKPNKNQTVVLERAPGYLYSVEAPDRIKKVNASMKIIVILRNPVKRVITQYYTTILSKLSAEKAKKSSFEKLVLHEDSKLTDVQNPAVVNSIYHHYVKRWLDRFPKNQVHIINGDAFIKNPLQELKSLETFLGVPHVLEEGDLMFNGTSGYFCPKVNSQPHCYGHSFHPNYIQEKDFFAVDKLKNFFRHHNDKLFQLIDERFEWT